MKPAKTSQLNYIIPPAPQRGDIKACKAYAEFKARQSKDYHKALADIWIRFMSWSYLDDVKEVQS